MINNNENDDGSEHLVITLDESAPLLAPAPTANLNKPGENYFIAEFLQWLSIIALIGWVVAGTLRYNSNQNGNVQDNCCIPPMSQGVEIAVISAGAIVVVGHLSSMCLLADTLSTIVAVFQAFVLLGLAAVEGATIATFTITYTGTLLNTLTLGAACIALLLHALCMVARYQRTIVTKECHTVNCPPDDAWCTLVYTEFGRPTNPPIFYHVPRWQTDITVGTGKENTFRLHPLPEPDYGIRTQQDGTAVDDDAMVLARRKGIEPHHFTLTKDQSGDVWIKLSPTATALPTFVGLEDKCRFLSGTRQYIGLDVEEVPTDGLSYEDVCEDALPRALPKSRDEINTPRRVFDLRMVQTKIGEGVTMNQSVQDLRRFASLLVAFSGVGTADRRVEMRGEVGVRIVLHKALKLLDSSKEAFPAPMASRTLRAGSFSTNEDVQSIKSISPKSSRRVSLGVGDASLTKLKADVKAYKKKTKAKEMQLKEEIRVLKERLSDTREVANAMEAEAMRQQEQAELLRSNSQSNRMSPKEDALLSACERLQQEVEELKTDNKLKRKQSKQLKSEVQALQSENESLWARIAEQPDIQAFNVTSTDASESTSTSKTTSPKKAPPPVKPRKSSPEKLLADSPSKDNTNSSELPFAVEETKPTPKKKKKKRVKSVDT